MKTFNILIPAFNASQTIEELIKQLFELEIKPDQIIVINDGSSDETSTIARELKVNVVDLPINRGKGASLLKGYEYFLHNSNVDYLICIDADLQHPVNLIPDFLKSDSQMVIGNRKKSMKTMPFHRIISNVITSKILSWVTGQKILDSQCGYRKMHRDVIFKLELNEKGFQLESEMIVEVAKMGVQIDFVNIPTIYNQAGSSISNVKDTLRFIRYILKVIATKTQRLKKKS